MSDAIANVDGRDLFATFREPAWHRKGTVFTEEVTSSDVMLEMAGLAGRIMTCEPLFVGTFDEESGILGNAEEVPSAFASVSTWKDGHRSFYGTVGNRYEHVQDSVAFGIFDGYRWETGGALYDGRKVFGSIAIDREIVLDPSGVADTVKTYGLVVNSHDGTSPLTFATTPVRVVCQNTLNAAMGSLRNVVKVRHTRTATERTQEAAAAWKAANGFLDVFESEAAALYAAAISDKQYENMFTTLFPKPEEDVKGSLTKWENKRGLYMQAWNGTPNEGIKGTAWGAWNALTEANQWGRSIRDSERGEDSFVSAGMGLDGPTNKFRQDALSLVKVRAGIK